MRFLTVLAVSTLVVSFVACSDDDGANVVPNGPPGSGGAGGAPMAGSGGTGGGGTGGSGGMGGAVGGSGGSAGCVPLSPDAGSDAGTFDAGSIDAGSDAGLDASAPGGATGVVSFASVIHPIFELSCAPCHVTLGSAGHNVGGELEQAYADAVRLGQTLVARIDGGGMPPPEAPPPNDCGADGGGQPGDEGCLTTAQVSLVQAWIDQCYPR